jgi:small conductance mechanosensitive channel
VLGVDKLSPTGAILKARVTTEPQAQWRVGREYNRRLKAAFDAAGIGDSLLTLGALPPRIDNTPSPSPSREPRAFAPSESRRPS